MLRTLYTIATILGTNNLVEYDRRGLLLPTPP